LRLKIENLEKKTPFSIKAQSRDLPFPDGGKKDDITLLVIKVEK
jgi:hypothetical protein